MRISKHPRFKYHKLFSTTFIVGGELISNYFRSEGIVKKGSPNPRARATGAGAIGKFQGKETYINGLSPLDGQKGGSETPLKISGIDHHKKLGEWQKTFELEGVSPLRILL